MIAVGLHHLGTARHEHAHQVLGGAVALVALDQDLLDVLGVEVADRALDQVGFLVHQRRGGRLERRLPDVVPLPQHVLQVALHLGLGAVHAGGPHDHSHALGHVEGLDDIPEPLAIGDADDLSADAAAAHGVGHQHAVAPGQRQIGRERGALIAALLLDHLDQEDLAPLHHLLNLVGPVDRAGDPRHLVVLAAAYVLDAVVQRLRGVLLVDLGSTRRHLVGFPGLVLLGGKVIRGRVVLRAPAVPAVPGAGFLGPRRLGLGGRLARNQRLPVGDRYLVVIRVDFVEGKEAVPAAAVIDERRL